MSWYPTREPFTVRTVVGRVRELSQSHPSVRVQVMQSWPDRIVLDVVELFGGAQAKFARELQRVLDACVWSYRMTETGYELHRGG